ncbi:hypothetical protein E3O55_07595 [Cryobacterium sp. MDB1-18-2]|uniref:hypothetical protein n=1 Tax=unclassified Cryobacterium TaxID=2649013 RepID=UPI00106D2DF1|nr:MULTISPECIES: hypothetical protein [unclassified Cryobacterium]TFC30734.1 hypothetical protein E3O55_07595 [Cryobacterium sp. MDB1-18-2]TFC38304.1 hypothetical protein E3O50_16750 [Cryobacterium sp. MDB1-18-1]
MNDDKIITALRSIDHAPQIPLDDTGRRRADARLQQILATDPKPEVLTSHVSRRSSVTRWVAIPAAIVLVAAAAAVIPGLGNPESAYASWTPTPTSIDAADQAVASAACLSGGITTPSPGILLAERRGEWVGLAYTSTNGQTSTCLTHLPVDSPHADNVMTGTASDSDAIVARGQFSEGAMSSYFSRGRSSFFARGDAPAVTVASGNVGEDVTGVTIKTADGLSVQATVEEGRYIAWWPGRGGAQGDAQPVLAYDIALSDGTVHKDAEPTRP